ncbi:hypothetical protein Leryth_026181 [Lithospermum erythrorhizon]|nr:hypothetical protein Leryth_026181 [Lithospermum erythrorhizon]
MKSRCQKLYGRPLYMSEYGASKLVNLLKKMSDAMAIGGKGQKRSIPNIDEIGPRSCNFVDIMNKSIGVEDPMKLVEENVMSDVSAAGGLRPPVICSGTSDLTEPIEVIKKAYMDSSRGHKESVPNGQHQYWKKWIQENSCSSAIFLTTFVV